MKVWHMSGAGNDFLVIDARNIKINMEKMAKELCSTYCADGFMALDNSCIADVKLHFYNKDGSRADMCGNGARCICRFAFDNGIVGKEMSVETDAGIVCGSRVNEDVYRVKLNTPKGIELDKMDGVDFAIVGVPHAVVKLDEIDWNKSDELLQKAMKIRFSSVFEHGANVNFYAKTDEKTAKILTFERGVEGFTLACGTGSGAVATILWSRGEMFDKEIIIKNQGGDLKVSITDSAGKIDALYLEGNAKILKIFEL